MLINRFPKPILNDITRGRYQQVINLKPQAWRRLVFSFLIFTLSSISLVFLFYSNNTKAQVAQFYPQSCLGNWLKSDLVEGEPNTIFNADFSNFNSTNSAMYDGGSKQIFCGGFVGKIPNIAKIQKVTLKIHWTKSKKREVISTFPTDEVIEKVVENPIKSTSTDATSTVVDETSGETIQDSNSLPVDTATSEEEVLFIDEPIETSTLAPEVLPVDTATSGEEVDSSKTQSFLNKFLNIAQAASPTTTITQLGLDNSSTTEIFTSTPTVNEPEVVDVVTNSSSTISNTPTFVQVFSSPGGTNYPTDALFVIKYSLDGNYWQVLGLVYEDNWLTEFDLPITLLTDLNKIQISIESLPQADDNLFVLLDGMTLEVNYYATKEIIIAEEDLATATSSIRQIKKPKKTFDARAKHSCRLEPFVVEINQGNNTSTAVMASSTIILEPSRLDSNFKLEFAALPRGLTAILDNPIASTSTASSSATVVEAIINAEPYALKGSYNAIVIYEEEQYDGEFLPNFCQINLVIK